MAELGLSMGKSSAGYGRHGISPSVTLVDHHKKLVCELMREKKEFEDRGGRVVISRLLSSLLLWPCTVRPEILNNSTYLAEVLRLIEQLLA